MNKRIATFSIGLAACAALSHGLGQKDDEYVLVAEAASAGIAPDHVRHLFARGGIWTAALQSSIPGTCRASVWRKDVVRALDLLQADAQKRPYMYIRIVGRKVKVGMPDPKTWSVRRFDLSLAGIAKSPVFKRDANLRALAKDAIVEAIALEFSKSRARALKPLAVVHEVHLFEMSYIGEDMKDRRGYSADVEFVFRGRRSLGTTKVSLEAWDEGRKVKLFFIRSDRLSARNPRGTTPEGKRGDRPLRPRRPR